MHKKRFFLTTFSAVAALGVAAFFAISAAFASDTNVAPVNSAPAAVMTTPVATAIPVTTPQPVATLSPTQLISAPRPALAISHFFTVPLTQVLVLRSEGWGYGEIFKLYQLSVTSGKTVTEVKALRDAGLGWGNLAKQLGVHPGNGGFNLGAALSDRDVIALTTRPSVGAPSLANPAVNSGGNQGNGGNPNRGKPDDKGKPEDRGNPGNPGNGGNNADKGNKKNK